jgi:(S)-mandelate dehydrogenase
MPWNRRISSGLELAHALNIADLREIAREHVPGFAFEYLEGGSEDELSLQGNRHSLQAIRLVPQTLVDTSERHQRIELIGRPSAAPLVIAPTGLNGMQHSGGDVALAKAAARFGIPFTLSTVSTTRLEEVAEEAGGRLWMQLYVFKDRSIAQDLIKRAVAANYEALVLTTDANVFGSREWDKRNYRAPGKPSVRAMFDMLRHPRWLFDVLLRNGAPRFRNLEALLPPGAANAVGASTVIPSLYARKLTWDDAAWLREQWPRKFLIKGILTPADAERAAALGCDGIVISNHGGRQLDSCIAPIDVLPEIVRCVGQRLTILIDSGFRRGTDVIKALALGANAVMLGRATLYGLAAGGEPGVYRALEILTTEIDRVMGQLGCPAVADLKLCFVRRFRPSSDVPEQSREVT